MSAAVELMPCIFLRSFLSRLGENRSRINISDVFVFNLHVFISAFISSFSGAFYFILFALFLLVYLRGSREKTLHETGSQIRVMKALTASLRLHLK